MDLNELSKELQTYLITYVKVQPKSITITLNKKEFILSEDIIKKILECISFYKSEPLVSNRTKLTRFLNKI